MRRSSRAEAAFHPHQSFLSLCLSLSFFCVVSLASWSFAAADPLRWTAAQTSPGNGPGGEREVPSLRSDGVMVYDPEDNRLILFGGKSSSTGAILQETWELRLSSSSSSSLSSSLSVSPSLFQSSPWNWTRITTQNTPPARFSFIGGLARLEKPNSPRFFVVATGDLGSNKRVNDVWALRLDGGLPQDWIKVETEGEAPAPRYGAVGGISSAIPTTLILSHGFDKQRYSDTFELDLSPFLSSFSLSSSSSSLPPSPAPAVWRKVYKGTMEYNPLAPHARCLGAGTVFSSSPSSSSSLSSPSLSLVLFGGCLTGGGSGGPCPSNDGWVFDLEERAWSRSSGGPGAVIGSRMVPLERSRRVLMYGGRQRTKQVLSIQESPANQVDVLDPQTGDWKQYEVKGTIPTKRENPFLVSFSLPAGESGSGREREDVVFLWGGTSPQGEEVQSSLFLLTGAPEETNEEDRGTRWLTLWHLHGALMFLSWGLLLPGGVLAARYLKHLQPEGKWFKIHRAVQMTGLLLAIGGFILGFLSASTTAVRHFTFPHSILGIVIMILGVAQPANAFIRPHKGEKYREIWSFIHKNVGRVALLLAFVNISLGLFMALAATFLWALWFAFLSLLFLSFLCLEIKQRKRESGRESLEDLKKKEEVISLSSSEEESGTYKAAT